MDFRVLFFVFTRGEDMDMRTDRSIVNVNVKRRPAPRGVGGPRRYNRLIVSFEPAMLARLQRIADEQNMSWGGFAAQLIEQALTLSNTNQSAPGATQG